MLSVTLNIMEKWKWSLQTFQIIWKTRSTYKTFQIVSSVATSNEFFSSKIANRGQIKQKTSISYYKVCVTRK